MRMSTNRPSGPSLWQEVAAALPQFDWRAANVNHGAFHEVAILGTSAAIRLCRGVGHSDRARREMRILQIPHLATLSAAVPGLLGNLAITEEWSAYATSVVPGRARPDIPWMEARTGLKTLLPALSGIPTAGLDPARQWCGGAEWPDRVDQILTNTDRSVRRAAKDVIARLLDAESTAPRTFVHGDLSLHNIFFSDSRISALIDFDSAGIGDPAADLAPLIGVFGSELLEDIVDEDTVLRARAHRATLPLQITAAAEIVGDSGLRDHAIQNFSDRLASGTLEQPDLSHRPPVAAAPRHPWSG